MGTMSTLAGDLYTAGLEIPADPAARAALVHAVLPLYALTRMVAAMPQPSHEPPPVPARADLARLLPALSDAPASALPPVIVADRWPFRAHFLVTYRDLLDHRAKLAAEYGACEWVCVGQDSPDPEIQFRVPNPARAADAIGAADLAQLDAFHAVEGADVSAAEQAADDENEYVLALVRQYGRGGRAA